MNNLDHFTAHQDVGPANSIGRAEEIAPTAAGFDALMAMANAAASSAAIRQTGRACPEWPDEDGVLRKVHSFAMGAAGIGPDHPLDFNVRVLSLPPEAIKAVAEAIASGVLAVYVNPGDYWVRLSDLEQAQANGDLRLGFPVPRAAIMSVKLQRTHA